LIAIGFISAFLSAMFVVRRMIEFVQTRGFAPFAYYRLALGTLMLLFIYLGIA
jgi:undecaprenyl-diphosphatase